MADEDLKARLKDHSKAFEGLMSLIPAEYYYGKDNSDQWSRKKQTKEEKRAAKMAKLQPGANKSALDVHREREQQEKDRKRKREAGEDAEVAPAEDANASSESSSKKQKVDDVKEGKSKNKKNKVPTANAEEEEAVRQEKANKRKEENRKRKEKRKADNQEKRDRRHARKAKIAERKLAAESGGGSKHTVDGNEKQTPMQTPKPQKKKEKKSRSVKPEANAGEEVEDDDDDDQMASDIELEGFADTSLLDNGQQEDEEASDASSVGSSPEQENLFDNSANHSSASSSSSVVPPSDPSDTDSKQKQSKSQPRPASKPKTLRPSSPTPATADEPATEDEAEDGEDDDVIFDARVDLPEDAPTTAQGSTSDGKSKPHQPPTKPPTSILKPSKTTPQATEESKQPSTTSDHNTDSQLPKIDREALTKRLSDKLAQLRAARKADGPDGKPAKNRAELIEARRKKAELRKQHKKEQRAKERVAKDAEEEAARLRGGNGSPLWSPSLYSPGGALANQQELNFQFGKVAFDDGMEVDAGAGFIKDSKKKRGKSDAKTALLAAEKKRTRLAGYDAAKRADIEEKDAWLAAKNRVSGEKARDDPNLLKKTIKRQEKAKGKSEKAWNERAEGVKKGQEARQHKREENLRKRKEMKGVKGKDRKKLLVKQKGGGVQKPKQRKRPGFEGTFKTAARRT